MTSLLSLVRSIKVLSKAALGLVAYSRPCSYWFGMHEYCIRGHRYDLLKVQPPDTRFPVYIRRGTSDILNYRQIFVDHEYGHLPISPSTVLDCGGYIGLASVYLANKYPDSQIVLIEPDPDNFAMALLNCRGYKNVMCLNYGICSKSCRIALKAQVGGDWGNMFEEVLATEGGQSPDAIEAKSIRDIMNLVDFKQLDFLKMDVEGTEKVLFDAPSAAEWLEVCQVISCELHDRMVPGCSESVYRATSKAGFSGRKYGEYEYFVRDHRWLKSPLG